MPIAAHECRPGMAVGRHAHQPSRPVGRHAGQFDTAKRKMPVRAETSSARIRPYGGINAF